LALVPCDNVPGNGPVVERVVRELAALVEPDLAMWIGESVSVVTTMVDRITPRTGADDVRAVRGATRLDDRAPVITEPFKEWVLGGSFPASRPRWEDAGAMFTDDVAPFEQRKLWLLNGGHSLLAYAGSIRGHTTVAEAVADDECRSWLEEWWTVASRHLGQPATDVGAYRAALVDRLANARIHHPLAQIAADGSQKLVIRVLPVLCAEREAGRLPAAATRILAAWICNLRGLGAEVTDVRADDVVPLAAGPLPAAVRRVLDALAPALAADDDVLALVIDQSEMLSGPPGMAG
jgi:fructuronate reductase